MVDTSRRQNPDKVAAVAEERKEPSSVKELTSFLAFANCYRRFVSGFAQIACMS